MKALLVVSTFILLVTGLRAQVQAGESPATKVIVKSPEPKRHANDLGRFVLPLSWNEIGGDRVLSLPLRNDGEAALQIVGVQATAGVFVGDYPSIIPPGKGDVVSVIYLAAANTQSSLETVRLLTNQGVKELTVQTEREAAAVLDKRAVQWVVGESAVAKSIIVELPGGRTALRVARSLRGVTTRIEFPTAGRAIVHIEPDSTDAPHTFPVWLDFDPALPGGPLILTGEVVPAKG